MASDRLGVIGEPVSSPMHAIVSLALLGMTG
jgi:hypothetical protein